MPAKKNTVPDGYAPLCAKCKGPVQPSNDQWHLGYAMTHGAAQGRDAEILAPESVHRHILPVEAAGEHQPACAGNPEYAQYVEGQPIKSKSQVAAHKNTYRRAFAIIGAMEDLTVFVPQEQAAAA